MYQTKFCFSLCDMFCCFKLCNNLCHENTPSTGTLFIKSISILKSVAFKHVLNLSNVLTL